MKKHPVPDRRTYGVEADRALDLWVALARCASSVSRVSSRDIQRHGLTQAQFAVLDVLYHKGPMALCTIGAKLLVTGGNVTFVVNQLDKSGWIKRRRSPDDGRVIVARLSAKGQALMDRCFPVHAAAMADAASALAPREQARLARLLKKWGKSVAG